MGAGGSREAGGPGVVAAHKRHARGEGPTQGLHGGQGHARRAHVEHFAHGRDAGGVEAQRLVEGRRVLPSRREGMRCGAGGEVRAGRREGMWWWRHDKRGMHGEKARLKACMGAKGTRGERT